MKVQTAFRSSGRVSSEDTGEKYKQRLTEREARKRKAEEGEESGSVKKVAPQKKAKKDIPQIGEHESLGDYNRRIEAMMRGGVANAIKNAESAKGQAIKAAKDAKAERIAKAQGKKVDAGEGDAANNGEEKRVLKPNRPAVEFASLPKRKRLNDIVEAPPQLPRMRQAVKAGAGAGSTGSAWGATDRTPLSAAQKRILETERERVVGLYREMKAKKEAEKSMEREKKEKKGKQ